MMMGAAHRGQVHHGPAFVQLTPFSGAFVPTSVCRALPGRVGGRSLHTATGRGFLRRPPSRGTASSRDAERRFKPVMREEWTSLPGYVAAVVDADYVPSVDFLGRFRDAAMEVSRTASTLAASGESFLAAAPGDVDWYKNVVAYSRQMRALVSWLSDVRSQADTLPRLCSDRPTALGEAVSLCGAVHYVLEQDKLKLLGEAMKHTAAAVFEASPSLGLDVWERLDHVAGFYEEASIKVRDLLPTLSGTRDELESLYFKVSPVAASLTPLERLPPGRQRSPGSTLSLVTPRDEAVCIRRDAEIVRLLAHLSVMLDNVRAASFVASFPGLGKSRLVWDVLEAWQRLDDPRYADAAQRARLVVWPDVVNKLRAVRACVLTFNSSSKWGKRDLDIVDQCLSHKHGMLLPMYLRLLWYLRWAESVPWEDFIDRAATRLKGEVITVDDIVAEAVRALREQPTVIIVEEIAKVPGSVLVRPGLTPAQREWPTLNEGEGNDGRQPLNEQRTVLTLFSLYRDEFCSFTGMDGASVAILFKSPSFGGVMFAHVKDVVALDMVARAGYLTAKLKSFGLPDTGVQNAMLSSKSSTRLGSPSVLLCAAELGYLNTDDVAAAYVHPRFQSRCRIRMSFSSQASYMLPAETAKRAFASLSGGYPRGAAVLRRALKNVTPGHVSSSVVIPAVTDLFDREDSTVAPLLDGMFLVPVVIVAAVHPCDVDCGQPICNHSTPPAPCSSWSDRVTSNALTAAVADSSGKIKNPSMPPLYLLALLQRWQQTKSKKVEPPSDKEWRGSWEASSMRCSKWLVRVTRKEARTRCMSSFLCTRTWRSHVCGRQRSPGAWPHPASLFRTTTRRCRCRRFILGRSCTTAKESGRCWKAGCTTPLGRYTSTRTRQLTL